jgi:hypothetical protein
VPPSRISLIPSKETPQARETSRRALAFRAACCALLRPWPLGQVRGRPERLTRFSSDSQAFHRVRTLFGALSISLLAEIPWKSDFRSQGSARARTWFELTSRRSAVRSHHRPWLNEATCGAGLASTRPRVGSYEGSGCHWARWRGRQAAYRHQLRSRAQLRHIRLIRPCSCGRAHDRSWKCLFAGTLS